MSSLTIDEIIYMIVLIIAFFVWIFIVGTTITCVILLRAYIKSNKEGTEGTV